MKVMLFLLPCLIAVVTSSLSEPQIDPASRQLLDFKLKKEKPDLLTTSSGSPVDIRETNSLNSNFVRSRYARETVLQTDSERTPERIVHAKGAGAFGYFELLRDMSKYTKAKIFTGVGKKTPVAARFSTVVQNKGGNDVVRETRGLGIKFYTEEGILDLIGLSFPVYFYRDPIDFINFAHAFKRNPATYLEDNTARYDFITQRPNALHGWLWLTSDYGIPKGYRKMDSFIQHAYELYNENGEKHYARINFRTEQGLDNYTSAEAQDLRGKDADLFIRDLYNAIARKNYPSWRVEMDLISEHELKNLNFDPFDLTRLWKRGSYKTISFGRLVLNQNPTNFFEQIEQIAFCPANLVPGINGAPDQIFTTRLLSYTDSARNRLGTINVNKVGVNKPDYARTYIRNGMPPLDHNMKDTPNYYSNSFKGPEPYVDAARPYKQLHILESNAVDLQPAWYFYNYVLASEGEKQRLADNLGGSLVLVTPFIKERFLKLLWWTDHDLAKRVEVSLAIQTGMAQKQAALDAAAEKDEIRRKQYIMSKYDYNDHQDNNYNNQESYDEIDIRK